MQKTFNSVTLSTNSLPFDDWTEIWEKQVEDLAAMDYVTVPNTKEKISPFEFLTGVKPCR